MVKVYDPDKRLRTLQNATILFLLYGSIVAFIFYVCTIIGIFVIEGLNQVLTLISLNVVQQIEVSVETAVYYYKLFIANVGAIGLMDYNFFLVKCATTMIFLPVFITGTLAFVFRQKIAEFVPIKKEASVHGDAHWASKKEVIKCTGQI